MPVVLATSGIWPPNLAPIPEDLARRILLRARQIAPQIRTVAIGSEEYLDALAVLRAVAKRATEIGTGAVASKGRNGTTISFRDIRRAFDGEYEAELRLVFDPEAQTPQRAMPQGSFPTDRPLGGIFPEGPYA